MIHEMSLWEMLMVFVRLGAALALVYSIVGAARMILLIIVRGATEPSRAFIYSRVGRVLLAGLVIFLAWKAWTTPINLGFLR
ncbi:MAG TPA: hypothetical protein VGN17_05230 [Bryobacteraceae bacterium]|jgi:hypothetical protein